MLFWSIRRFRLPRLRGDGPREHLEGTGLRQAPPPTRGWTRHRGGRDFRSHGSPAYAGMDPRRPFPRRGPLRLPRLRGDGPGVRSVLLGGVWAPPPTRGWTLRSRVAWRCEHGSPAYAGMDPSQQPHGQRRARLPRLRGDGPILVTAECSPAMAPPPTRGWTLRLRRSLRRRAGSPAYAGMDPGETAAPRMLARLPRLRGDGPAGMPSRIKPTTAPPPTRGWTRRELFEKRRALGSPAYAGMESAARRAHFAAPTQPDFVSWGGVAHRRRLSSTPS